MDGTAPPSATEKDRRWVAAALLVVGIVTALALNSTPWLRGRVGEWVWRHELASNLRLFPFCLLIAGAVAWLGWKVDVLRGRARWAALAGLLLAALWFQWSLVAMRNRDAALILAQRTMVHFLEDYFPAAVAISDPRDAYDRYEFLSRRYNRLRIATHPPGLIAAYRVLLDVAGAAPSGMQAAVAGMFSGEADAAKLSPLEGLGLGLITLLKAFGGVLLLPGVVLLARALLPDDAPPVAGRVFAAMALMPGVALFSFCLDHLFMGLGFLATGLLAYGIRRGLPGASVASGFVFFLQAQVAYHATAASFVALVLVLVLAKRRGLAWRSVMQQLGAAALGGLAPTVALYLTTDFNWLQQLLDGKEAHLRGGIHQGRSRWGWIPWNVWDVVLFSGMAWLPWAAGKAPWRHPAMVAVGVTLLIVFALDGVRGEAARLFLFLQPFLAAAFLLERGALDDGRDYCGLTMLLAVQAVALGAVLNLF